MEILDPESEHVRVVYAHFGLASYQAQCVERQLAILLTTEYRDNNKRMTRQDLDALNDKLFKQTLGTLIENLRKSVVVPSDLDARLSAARHKRNWLTHDYFWDRAGHFMSEEGRDYMISELRSIIEELGNLDEQMISIARAWAAKNGISPEFLLEQQELLVSSARSKIAGQ